MSPLLALVAFQSAVIDPAVDPALAKKITLRLPFATLREVTAGLAKASGQPIDASGVVTDWKATVLVKDLSAGRTMEALADSLGLVWKKDGEYYRLSRPDGSAAAETAYLQAEAKAAVSQVPVMNLQTGQAPVISGVIQRQRPPIRGGSGRPLPPAVTYDPAAGAARVYSRFDPNILGTETSGGPAPSRLGTFVVPGDLAFSKTVVGWASMPSEIAPEWETPIAGIELPTSPWESGAYSLGDLLAAWHDATGLPVVADAFRVPMKSRSLAPGTALASLQGLAGAESVTLRLKDGVARLRHPGFWRLRKQEIPEATWASIERGKPNVDALAAFAARLTAPQAASFRSLEPPLSKIKTIALRDSYPALLLWNALPSPAKRALLSGSPVALSAVQGASNAYGYALREAPYYRAGDPTPLLAMEPRLLGIFGSATPTAVELRLSGERGGGVTYGITLP
jgi:hypothetical protein